MESGSPTPMHPSGKVSCIHEERFPLWFVLFRQAQAAAWIGTGMALMILAAWWAVLAWGAFMALTLGLVLAGGCRHCRYNGKRCDSGLGLVAGLLFRNAPMDVERFQRGARRSLPFLIVAALAPLAAGAWLLIEDATWGRVVLVGAYVAALALVVAATPLMACPRCAMRGECPLGGGGKGATSGE